MERCGWRGAFGWASASGMRAEMYQSRAHRNITAAWLGGFVSGDLRCLLGDIGKGNWIDTQLPPLTSIMIPRRIARPLGAFAKEWTCPSCVRLHARCDQHNGPIH
jgi:hypothetical protein